MAAAFRSKGEWTDTESALVLNSRKDEATGYVSEWQETVEEMHKALQALCQKFSSLSSGVQVEELIEMLNRFIYAIILTISTSLSTSYPLL